MSDPKKQSPAAKLMSFFKMADTYREIALCIALASVFFGYMFVAPLLDPTSRSLDLSYIQKLIFQALQTVFTVFIVWVIISVAFPTFDKYLGDFKKDWDNMSEVGARHRVWTFLAFLMVMYFLISKSSIF